MQTYVGNAYVYQLQHWQRQHSFSIHFFLFRFLVAQGNVFPLVTTGKYQNIQNSSGKYNLAVIFMHSMPPFESERRGELLTVCISGQRCLMLLMTSSRNLLSRGLSQSDECLDMPLNYLPLQDCTVAGGTISAKNSMRAYVTQDSHFAKIGVESKTFIA